MGTVSVCAAAAPIQGPLGLVLETHAAPLVLAGYLAGPVGGAIAACIAGTALYLLDGAAIVGGVASVFLPALAGIVFAALMEKRQRPCAGPARYVLLSLTATALTLPVLFIEQPAGAGSTLLRDLWPTLLIGNLIGVPLLGLTVESLMKISLDRDRYALDLELSGIARQAARIGMWTHDTETDRAAWDATQHDLMGLEPETFDGTRRSFLDLVLPGDRDALQGRLRAAEADGGAFTLRFRIRTPNGEIRHIQSHGRVVEDLGGRRRRIVGVDVDVTHEDEFAAIIRQNSAALDSAVCGVVITEAKGTAPIVYVNRAFTEITGYRADDAVGLNCRFLNEGLDNRPERDHIRRTLAEGGSCTVTVRNRRKNGTLFWNTLRISPIHNTEGEITHFIGIQDDVTEQVEARQLIADARDQLMAIVSTAPDAILSVDSRQQIVSFNPAAVTLFGWREEEILGRSVHELVPEPARATHRELVHDYIDNQEAEPGPMSTLRTIKARRKDGSTFPAQVSLARHQVGGEPMVTATARDISEAVAANEKLVRLSNTLRDRLTEAHRASEAKDHFMAHMSHELRTPLNAIIGYSDMMATLGIDTLGPNRVTEYVSDIKRSGQHLLSLINDILDLSKLQAGRTEPSIAVEDAGDILDEALSTVGPTFADRSLRTRLDRQEAATVFCDRRLTLQCLLNLLSNAAKHAPEASLVIATQRPVDGGIRFSIEDEGPGIPDYILERIGEPFLRDDDPLTSNGAGYGLGLAITKQLVDRQNGRLEIVRGRRGGTVASIWLPATPPAVAEDDAWPTAARLKVARPKVD